MLGVHSSQGGQRPGWIVVRGQGGGDAVFINGADNRIAIRDTGGNDRVVADGDARIAIRREDGKDALLLDGAAVNETAGFMVGTHSSLGGQRPGWVVVRDETGNDAVYIDGSNGYIRLGAGGTFDFAPTIELNGSDGRVLLRGITQDSEGFRTAVDRIALSPEGGSIWLGGNGANGDVVVLPESATSFDTDQAVIWIRGSDGDIRLSNADCAEEFDLDDSAHCEPGTVMIINRSGRLEPCRAP